MGFLDKLREALRDHTRDNICAGLQALGIDAQMAAQGRPEETIETGFYTQSLGMIDIAEGPIRWVNVRKRQPRGPDASVAYYTDYGVPDTRLEPDSPRPRIESVRIKTSLLVGQVVDLRWRGEDFGLGIVSRLNSDASIKGPIMRSRDVTIQAYSDHKCWIISTETRDPPSGELWSCYQAIARHLLAEWLLEYKVN